jgi:hypothetical protein
VKDKEFIENVAKLSQKTRKQKDSWKAQRGLKQVQTGSRRVKSAL